MKQLQTFLKDNRNEWSENTKKRIINRLSYEIDLPINDESDRKVVVVSSREPQHGKTTFILRLIGIKEEYEKEVGTLLRAGRPLGKSSTSTAIIYGKSHNDKYGISSGTLDDKGEMHFCENDDEMISRMQQIRNDVENGHRPPNTILWINLPNKYFGQDVWTENIRVNIIDLPGSGSSNDRERIYVEKLTQIYFRIATTNIIVISDNNIAHIENYQELAKYSNKYMLAVTRLYSLADHKEKWGGFGAEKVLEEGKKECITKFEEYFGTDAEKPFFIPLELGNSLCSLKEKNVEYYESVRLAVDQTLDETRRRIESIQGNKFSGWIDTLKDIINETQENEIVPKKKEIEALKEEISKQEDKQKKYEEQRKRAEDEKKSNEKQYEEITNIERVSTVDIDSNYIEGKVNDWYYKHFNEEHKYLNDKDKKIADLFEKAFDAILSEITDEIKEKYKQQYQNSEFIDVSKFGIIETAKIISDFHDGLKSELSGRGSSNIIQSIKEFLKFNKMKNSEKKAAGVKQLSDACEEIKTLYITKEDELFRSKTQEFKEKKEQAENAEKIEKHKILNVENKISRDSKRKEQLEKEINWVKDSFDRNKKILAKYKRIAREEFEKQYKKVKAKVLDESLQKQERIYWLILLALITRDFEKIGD